MPSSARTRAGVTAHSTLPMIEVLSLIAKELGGTLGEAKSFYVWLVENKRPLGLQPSVNAPAKCRDAIAHSLSRRSPCRQRNQSAIHFINWETDRWIGSQ